MKLHQLTGLQTEQLLRSEAVGRLGSINSDGFPYVVPVHFVHYSGKIYIHGLVKGQKINNIVSNPRVCFEVDHMDGIIMSEEPCDVNTSYQSVIIQGSARLVEGQEEKRDILRQIIDKYAPELSGMDLPVKMLDATSVIEIEPKECTGKYYGQHP